MLEGLIVAGGAALLAARLYVDNTLIEVSKYEIKNNKIPKEFNKFKIVQLSDFHSYGFEKDDFILLEKIYEEEPDMIVMTGDMVNKYDTKFEKFLNLAETLSKRYKIYYIVGNHEIRLKKEDLEYLLNKLRTFGIKILNDEKITMVRKSNHINIYGLHIPLAYYKVINRPDNVGKVISKVLKNCKEEEFNILLAHNPLFFEEYSKYNVDLTLSGHVHGGMIRLPLLGAILSPERKFFPKYSHGIYEVKDKKLVVSRGLGHSKRGIRFFNKRDLVSITLYHVDNGIN
ncbi:metallophosphoesterase [Clostridium sp. C2-6-12]|uniref:metallophosphoesterase n=1 Tax=Clostridium sp. C2-6-12 TaxID=2698832 RepID=UPI00136D1322|nr:metallophosphoesterase [Clostridium sp. C2-6-12]